jgi:hypothetical protein
MIFSIRKKFLFIHVPKTAGTSIRTVLKPYRHKNLYHLGLFVSRPLSFLAERKLPRRLPFHGKAIDAYERLPRDLFDELFKFAFVRNPWDLQVSGYLYVQRSHPELLKGINGFESFLKWVHDPKRPPNYYLDNGRWLQSDYLVDSNGRVLVDFIGRFESLKEDFEKVCRQIGISCPTLPHKKRSDRSSYQTYYTDRTKELVSKYCRRDIEMFGYYSF